MLMMMMIHVHVCYLCLCVSLGMAGVFRRALSLTYYHHSLRIKICKMSSQTIVAKEFFGKTDHHCGVHIDSTKEPCDVNNIVTCLRASLEKWKMENIKTVWFKIERNNSDWIPHLINEGFYFHHAKKNFVTLYHLLDSNYDIPPYAHTNIGVGAFVLNELTNEILVIKEKHSSLPVSRWKLPGGYVEPGENIMEAAERELLEETGISGKFKSLVGFRHAHNYAFGCSDIYMVARLSPVTFDIKKCDKEISECVWMKLEEYANNPDVYEQNRLIARKMMEYIKKNLEIGLVNAKRVNSTEPVWIYLINDQNEPTPTSL